MQAILDGFRRDFEGLLRNCSVLLTALSKFEITIVNNFSFSLSDLIVLAVLGYIAITIINFILDFIGTTFMPTKSLKSYGEYAVVTGATDGIGKERIEHCSCF